MLLTHITTSVGWLGTVLAYVALDVTATVSDDVQTVRAAYLAMALLVTYVIVPIAVAAVLIGIVNALGTTWGLFRHYWVVAKLLLTALAAIVLLVEAQTVRSLSHMATAAADPRDLPGTLPHSVGGTLILLLVTILSIYKPRGLTRHGWRRQQQRRREPPVGAPDPDRSQIRPRTGRTRAEP